MNINDTHSSNMNEPNQKLLAIGNREGTVRILGRPGIDLEIQHENGASAAVSELAGRPGIPAFGFPPPPNVASSDSEVMMAVVGDQSEAFLTFIRSSSIINSSSCR